MYKYLTVLLFTSLSVLAQEANTGPTKIYKYKDGNGNIIFTSTPPTTGGDMQPVKLPNIHTINSAENSSTNTKNQNANVTTNNAARMSFYLEGIPTEEALRANNGTFPITIKSDQAIIDSSGAPYSYMLLINGKALGNPQPSPTFQMQNLPRGEYSLTGNILRKGIVIAKTPTITFTIQRVNTNNSPAFKSKKP